MHIKITTAENALGNVNKSVRRHMYISDRLILNLDESKVKSIALTCH